jgi:hypothetical protein
MKRSLDEWKSDESDDENVESLAKRTNRESTKNKEETLALLRECRDRIFVYARTRESFLQTDGAICSQDEMRFQWYNVVIDDYRPGSYRYSFVKVSGEYTSEDLQPSRVFVCVGDPRGARPDCARDNFDDDLAFAKLLNRRRLFSSSKDRLLVTLMRPLFGFLDDGHTIARSAQNICVNPLLAEFDWWKSESD